MAKRDNKQLILKWEIF